MFMAGKPLDAIARLDDLIATVSGTTRFVMWSKCVHDVLLHVE